MKRLAFVGVTAAVGVIIGVGSGAPASIAAATQAVGETHAAGLHAAAGVPSSARDLRFVADRLSTAVTARLKQAPVIDKVVVYGTTALLDWHVGGAYRESLLVREFGIWKIVVTTKRDGIDYALLRLRAVPKERALKLDYENNRQCVHLGEIDLAPEFAVQCNDLQH